MTTLSERLRLAMEGPPLRTATDIARACNIKPPSVSAWLSGKTKKMEGSNLLAAAEFLRVNPWWLAAGVGPMRARYELDPGVEPAEQPVQTAPNEALPELQSEVLDLVRGLTPRQQQALVEELRQKVAYNDELEAELTQRRMSLVTKKEIPVSKIGVPLSREQATGQQRKNKRK